MFVVKILIWSWLYWLQKCLILKNKKECEKSNKKAVGPLSKLTIESLII